MSTSSLSLVAFLSYWMKDNWFVVSGFREVSVYYLIRLFGRRLFQNFRFVIPRIRKTKWDPALTNFIENFESGQLVTKRNLACK